MSVIGHQTIGRAKHVVADHGVEECFAKLRVAQGVEPASRAAVDGHDPMHHGEATVKFGCEAREVSAVG